jgi:hypothetical protein
MQCYQENIKFLRKKVIGGEIFMEEAQTELVKMILSSEIEGAERFSIKVDNLIEVAIYTLNPENQKRETLRVIDSVEDFLCDNGVKSI